MTELKTLKDIQTWNGCLVEKRKLKQEAIKWIKEGAKDDEQDTWFDNFKDFFNITAEDLK